MDQKECYMCKQKKSIEEFVKNKNYCKKCASEYNKKRRAALKTSTPVAPPVQEWCWMKVLKTFFFHHEDMVWRGFFIIYNKNKWGWTEMDARTIIYLIMNADIQTEENQSEPCKKLHRWDDG